MNEKFKQAFTHYQRGELNEAEKLCLNIKSNNPDNFQILNLLGIILFQKKTINHKQAYNSLNLNVFFW